jgi:protein TonB
MNSNIKKVARFDDLIFENRNKEYGAYQLRKRYKSVLITGIFVASLLISAIVIIPFVITPSTDRVLAGGTRHISVQFDNLEPPKEEIFIPPAAAPPPPAANVQEVIKYVPPVVVDTVLPMEQTQVSVDEVLASNPTTELLEKSGYGYGTGDGLIPGLDGPGTDEPFAIVEIMPSFRGGDINKFRDWVQKRTNYPQAAIVNRIQGRVYLTFIVEPDGSVSNVTVVKGVDPIIDNEAVKAIEASPKWSPGLQRGQPVRVRYSISLSFVI